MLSFVKALNAWRAGRRRSEIAVPTKGLAWQKAARGRHSVTRRLRLSASEAGSEKLGRPCPEVRLDTVIYRACLDSRLCHSVRQPAAVVGGPRTIPSSEHDRQNCP